MQLECQGDWIQTFTGKKFHVIAPRVEEIDIVDIAHALSNSCRWSGHCKQFYSVAQHSCFVSENCPTELKMWGLLHDAAEAYIGDLNRPFKLSGKMDEYILAEQRIMDVVCEKFGLTPGMPLAVKEVDNRVLQTEANQILGPRIDNWSIAEPYDWALYPVHPRVAKSIFLDTFKLLGGKL